MSGPCADQCRQAMSFFNDTYQVRASRAVALRACLDTELILKQECTPSQRVRFLEPCHGEDSPRHAHETALHVSHQQAHEHEMVGARSRKPHEQH